MTDPRIKQLPLLLKVPIELVYFNPNNVRERVEDVDDLAASIAAHGILQPLVVQPHPTKPDAFMLIAGHRRLEAAGLAQLEHVPVIVRGDIKGNDVIEAMLIENMHRQRLDPIEEARAIRRLMAAGNLSQAEVAARLGISQPTVSKRLELLDLSPKIQAQVQTKEVTLAQAKAIVQGQTPQTGTRKVLTDHFTGKHGLAKQVAARCDAQPHHERRRKLGKTGCGECWEWAIRADERRLADIERTAAQEVAS